MRARASPGANAVDAQDFCLPASSGETHCLRDFLERGPVVVLFYRGHW